MQLANRLRMACVDLKELLAFTRNPSDLCSLSYKDASLVPKPGHNDARDIVCERLRAFISLNHLSFPVLPEL